MTKDINKNLISQFLSEYKTTERLESGAIYPITEKIDKNLLEELTKGKLSNIDSKNIRQNEFNQYLQNLLPKKKQVYNPHLDDMLYKLLEFEELQSYKDAYNLAKDIFTQHKDILSFDTATKVLLLLASEYIQDENYEDATILLSNIETYEKHLTTENKVHFLNILTRYLYIVGMNTNNHFYLTKLINYSYKLLKYSNIIDKGIVKENLVIQINALWILGSYKECLLAIKNFFNFFPITTDDELNSQIMYIQGDIYEVQKKYNLAIQSFKLYLKFHPNDQITKDRIRRMAEQKGEEG